MDEASEGNGRPTRSFLIGGYMDYLILTVKQKIQTTCGEVEQIGYLCVNAISRCKNAQGKDILQFVISGGAGSVFVEDVVCITPSTPTPTQISSLK